MLQGALNDIVKQGHLDTILVRQMDKLVESIRFKDAVTQRNIGYMSFITPVTVCDKEHLDRILEEVYFERN